MKFRNIKVMSSAITLLVIMVLMLLAPASAIDLGIAVDDSNPNEGETITFTVEADVNDDERIPFTDFTVRILNSDGNSMGQCTFDFNGNKESNCNSIAGGSTFGNITPIQNDLVYEQGYGFGYGYGTINSIGSPVTQGTNFTGYGYGYSGNSQVNELSFDVEFTPAVAGDYSAKFIAQADDGTTTVDYETQNDVSFTVSATSSSSGGGGGGSSSSSSEVIRDDDEVTKIADELKVEKDNIRRVEVISKGADRTSSSNNETFESLEEDDKRVVEENSQNRKQSPKSIKRSTEVLRVSFDDFTSRTVTRIINEVEDSEDENLRIIEIIPKSMTNSVDDIEGNFEVLRDNPIIAFDSAQYEYYVNGDQTTQTDEITTLVFTGDEEIELPEKEISNNTNDNDNTIIIDDNSQGTNVSANNQVENSQNPNVDTSEETTQEESNNAGLYIVLGILLLVIAGIGFFFYTRKEN